MVIKQAPPPVQTSPDATASTQVMSEKNVPGQKSRRAREVGTRFDSLSPREAQLLSFAAAGYIDKQISLELGVSINTLRTYWQRIRSKVGEASRSALAVAYVAHTSEQESRSASEVFLPDWEIDLQLNTIHFLTDKAHPQRALQDRSLEELIDSYLPEDRPGLWNVIARVKAGELEAFYLTGRIQATHGFIRASAYIQVLKNELGQPVKLLGKRIPLIDVSQF